MRAAHDAEAIDSDHRNSTEDPKMMATTLPESLRSAQPEKRFAVVGARAPMDTIRDTRRAYFAR